MTAEAATGDTPGALDEEFFFEHFSMLDPRFAEQFQQAIPELLSRCPVADSDAFGGFWVVSSYDGVAGGFQDWQHLSSAPTRSITPMRPGQPRRRPIDLDAPAHRGYRKLLNPYLTPARVARFEPWIRALVVSLIDEFIEHGRCELVSQFSRVLPGRMLFHLLFGIDDAEVPMVQAWVHRIVYDPAGPDTPAAEQAWIAWMYDVIERRREGPRQDDLIDAMLHGEVDGARLADDEIMTTMFTLIQGGFGTTADAASTIVMHLAQRPDLQARLRADRAMIPHAIEEFMRFEPPISGQPRLCVQDTTIGDRSIKAGDRLFMLIAAANRDPDEFDDPERIDIDRSPNRHVAFGIGPHRCIGSNVARLNLRIMLEELLDRLGDFAIAPDEPVQRLPSTAWGPTSLPIVFPPGARSTSA